MIAALASFLAQTTELRVLQTLALPEPAVAVVAVQTGSGAHEALMTVAATGAVRVFVPAEQGGLPFGPEPVAGPVLDAPARTLFTVGRLSPGDGPDELVTLSPAGAALYPLDPRGVPAAESQLVSRRARFDLRVGAPQAAPFLHDLEGDGTSELLVPAVGEVAVWSVEARGTDGLRARQRLLVAVDTAVDTSLERDDLTDPLRAEVELPGLVTEDLTGDGLDDLVVSGNGTRAFHLARPDGGLPAEPDVRLDLSLYRDADAARDGFELGRTLSLGGEARLRSRDLDGDGIPDHVIFAGRKLWVFPSGPAGPQFTEPSTILKSAEDITFPLLVSIDDDDLPDLVLLRLRLPSVATLVMGLVRSFEVELRASAYRNLGAGRFEQRPSQDGGLALRVPPILDVLRDPAGLVERFSGVGREYGQLIPVDLDGDGADDLAHLRESPDGSMRIDLWLGADSGRVEQTRDELDGIVRDALFGEGTRVWDIDRVLAFLESQGSERLSRATAGATPDASLALPAGFGPETELGACHTGAGGVLFALDASGVAADRILILGLNS